MNTEPAAPNTFPAVVITAPVAGSSTTETTVPVSFVISDDATAAIDYQLFLDGVAPRIVVIDAQIGGGFGLACVSDVAITLHDAKFGLPETGLGILPAQIAPFVVQRVGLTQARRLALMGARFNGTEAVRLGIAHSVANNADELEAELALTLSHIKKCAPTANRLTKQLLHRVGAEPLAQLLDDAALQFSHCVSSAEGAEGTMAFVQKRSAAWAE